MLKQIAIALSMSAVVFSTFTPIVMTDAEAKSYGSRSFSSSSFSRSSYRSPSKSSWGSSSKSSSKSSKGLFSSYKSKSTTKKKSVTKTTTNKFSSSKTTGSSKTSKSKPVSYKTVTAGKSTRQAKSALTTQRNKFKKPSYASSGTTSKSTPSARNASYRSKYSSNPTYSRAASYDRGTYHTRRNQYYAGYNTPSYAYYGSPSYGMWDTIFLYSMMSNMNNNNASQFAYNHQNDADYKQWRREADKLSQDNAELRAQLAQIDAGQSQYAGKPINADYLPEGVDADLAMSQEIISAQKPTMRVCVGGKDGTYFRVTAGVLMQSINSVNIVPILTHGTGEILENIANDKCDAGFVQADGYWNYIESKQVGKLPFERVSSPYKEAVHLICNEDGVRNISDLTSNHRVWFPAKSGAAETWANFSAENSKYEKVQTVLTNKSMQVETYAEAVLKASADKNSCAMYVGAINASKFIKSVESGAKTAGLILANINDNDLNDTTDPSSRPVYKFGSIKGYKNLNRKGSCYGLCAGDINSLMVNADFIVANNWKANNKTAYPTFALDMMGVQPEIATAVRN